MKYTTTSLFLTLLFLSTFALPLQAQTDKELLKDLMEEEQEAVNALVLYPEETRKHILESTLHPDALIKLESVQNRTSTAFRELMEPLAKKEQEAIWDLTRYPGLIHQLALQRTGSKKSIEDILADYPEVIHRRAKEVASNQNLPLVAVDELNQAAESAFNSTLSEYPPKTETSLRALLALPEVLTILTENIRLTVLVGHVYAKEPAWVLQQADSLHLEMARLNAQELEDWKTSVENDPEAMAELNASAKAYNEEYGYDDAYYEYEEEVTEAPREQVVVHHHHYDYYYPYWFSYPYWYAYPRWTYHPAWYDWGFYYYPDQPVFFFGLPSYYFLYWYFDRPYHHRYYPHLSAHFVRHYHGHRRSGSGISTAVNDWQHKNRDVISKDWMKDDGKLPKRFKEYGEFESSREKYNQKNPSKEISRKDFVNQHEKKYPDLSKSTRQLQKEKVAKNPPTRDYPVTPKTEKPTKKEDKKKDPINPKVDGKDKRQDPKPKVDSGKDYHKNAWEKSKSQREKSPSRTAPRTSTKPKAVTPKSKPTTKSGKSGRGG
jgi:hypothetical protein